MLGKIGFWRRLPAAGAGPLGMIAALELRP